MTTSNAAITRLVWAASCAVGLFAAPAPAQAQPVEAPASIRSIARAKLELIAQRDFAELEDALRLEPLWLTLERPASADAAQTEAAPGWVFALKLPRGIQRYVISDVTRTSCGGLRYRARMLSDARLRYPRRLVVVDHATDEPDRCKRYPADPRWELRLEEERAGTRRAWLDAEGEPEYAPVGVQP